MQATNVGTVAAQPPSLLAELPSKKRWRDWWTRTLWTVIMIFGFFAVIASGHLSVIVMVVSIQTIVFKEVIAIAHVPSKEKKLPWFRVINWYD
jgi:phosphatidate cytidylyltransferase